MNKLSGQALDDKLKGDMERCNRLQPLARKHKLHILHCSEAVARQRGYYLFSLREGDEIGIHKDVPIDFIEDEIRGRETK